MESCIVALAALLFAPGLCPANPVAEYFLSEIQVAPDSLERIEVHMYTRERPFPVDLSGWRVTTRTCTAYVDSGVMLLDASGRRVIDLHPGSNDVRHLTPGVYFIATPSPSSSPPQEERAGVRGHEPSRVTKVILTM